MNGSIQSVQFERYRIAIPSSRDGMGIGAAVAAELRNLGHDPFTFQLESELPGEAEVVFFFGPFGKFVQVAETLAQRPAGQRPSFVYWNTEGLPDPRLPRPLTDTLSAARSWYGRLEHSKKTWVCNLVQRSPFSKLEPRFWRFRYLGDYLYIHRRGWVDVFADISAVYAGYWRQRGIPSLVAPFGSHADWYADLDLERDVDVLWMGKRATARRSQAIDALRQELRANGVEMMVVDNVERPFVFDDERTRLLNRTKITLNLLRTWYDENSLRICMAAPNRSLVVSEPLLPHVPQYQPGVHYVAAPLESLAQTILYYLKHEEERRRIVDNAYRVSTEEVTFFNSMKLIMDAVTAKRQMLSVQDRKSTLVRV